MASPNRPENAPGASSRVSRRTTLTTAAAVLAGAAAGTAGAVGYEEYKQDHPSPTARVSPLVQSSAIGSPTPIVWRGGMTGRRVALTFDDGPDPHWTPMALDLLAKHGAKGSFFMLGSAVAQYPEIAKAVAEAGHEIGSHGWDHRHMNVLTTAELTESLGRTHRHIIEVTGRAPSLIRPPYGQFDAAVAWAIARMNYSIILWSHRMTADHPEERAKENVATATPGMIMLSHDGRGTPTMEQMQAIDQMIVRMQQAAWEFVSVSELLQ